MFLLSRQYGRLSTLCMLCVCCSSALFYTPGIRKCTYYAMVGIWCVLVAFRFRDCSSLLLVCVAVGTRRILANEVYQEYIKDKNHYHMNATRVRERERE